MTDSTSQQRPSGKTVEQLLDEFRVLDQHAREIQAKLAAIAQQLAERGIKEKKPDQSQTDTVTY